MIAAERHVGYAEHPDRVLAILRRAREMLDANPWDVLRTLEAAIRELRFTIALPTPKPEGIPGAEWVCLDWPTLRIVCALLARAPGPGHKPQSTSIPGAEGMGGPGERYRRAIEERETRTSSYERGLWFDSAIAQAEHEINQASGGQAG